MLYSLSCLVCPIFPLDIFLSQSTSIWFETTPRNANAKEVREFMMSMMDEAEKQISYEENYEIIIKLNNYILPSLL